MTKLNSEKNSMSIIEWAEQIVNEDIDYSTYTDKNKKEILEKLKNNADTAITEYEKADRVYQDVIHLPEIQVQSVLFSAIELIKKKKQESIFQKIKNWVLRKSSYDEIVTKLKGAIKMIDEKRLTSESRLKDNKIFKNRMSKDQKERVAYDHRESKENTMFKISALLSNIDFLFNNENNTIKNGKENSNNMHTIQNSNLRESIPLPPPFLPKLKKSVQSVNITNKGNRTPPPQPPRPDDQKEKQQTNKKDVEKRSSKPKKGTGNVFIPREQYDKSISSTPDVTRQGNSKEGRLSQPKLGIVKTRIKAIEGKLSEHRKLTKKQKDTSKNKSKNRGL